MWPVTMVITAMIAATVMAAAPVAIVYNTTIQHHHYTQNSRNLNYFFHGEYSFTFL